MSHVSDFPTTARSRWRRRITFLVVSVRQFIRRVSDLRGLAQTFPVRLPDDASILRVVPDRIFIYPLSKYESECGACLLASQYVQPRNNHTSHFTSSSRNRLFGLIQP